MILVDADGCPVKSEICKVAARHGLEVTFVSNSTLPLPGIGQVELVVVGKRFDAVDDWIAGRAAAGDIVITSDIPLAARCLDSGARVLAPTGRAFTPENIGDALAGRELMSQLRDSGIMTGGPAPFDRKSRSRFLERLEATIREALRET